MEKGLVEKVLDFFVPEIKALKKSIKRGESISDTFKYSNYDAVNGSFGYISNTAIISYVTLAAVNGWYPAWQSLALAAFSKIVIGGTAMYMLNRAENQVWMGKASTELVDELEKILFKESPKLKLINGGLNDV